MLVEDRPAGFRMPAVRPEERFLFDMGLTYWTLKGAFERHVGLSQTRMQLLGSVYMAGEMSQAELQRRLDVDGAAVTRQVKQLEADGLLTRRPDPADNRYTLVALTPAGTEKLKEVAEKGKALLAAIVAGIDVAEMGCMQRVMARMRENAGGLCAGEKEA